MVRCNDKLNAQTKQGDGAKDFLLEQRPVFRQRPGQQSKEVKLQWT
jgi:hypothetical protein